jgi:hypothetical protein
MPERGVPGLDKVTKSGRRQYISYLSPAQNREKAFFQELSIHKTLVFQISFHRMFGAGMLGHSL